MIECIIINSVMVKMQFFKIISADIFIFMHLVFGKVRQL